MDPCRNGCDFIYASGESREHIFHNGKMIQNVMFYPILEDIYIEY